MRLEADGTRDLACRPRHPLRKERGYLLVGAVLQQAREEQVARLQEGEVLLVLDFATRQESRCLQVEQRRGHDEEFGRFIEVPVRALGAQVRDELVRDDVQGELGDLQLVLGDELKEQVERPLEGADGNGESRSGRRGAVRA